MIEKKLLAIAEAVLFAAAEPIEHTRLSIVLGTDSEVTLEILDILKEKYEQEESGLCLLKLGSKYQLCSKKEYINEVRAVLDLKRNTPLSQAAFEVLAIIAYNQPITKPYIEQIRGVDCSGVVSTLCQRGLIEEKGRLEVPGRPVLYGTTDDFLRCFSLSALSELEELPNVDKQVLMSDIDSGQLSLFDNGDSDPEVNKEDKEPATATE
ncbi:MAG: SMC-Scp complex subunit ScpB [Clostridia bacterium]|nr:SMC-Scp complex subunit ScpB [Clostridia bacterium]MBR3809774.1 SMC-Scp complex subunit ScpB [Clostridia bacterium]